MRGWHIIIWLGEGNGAYKTGTEILLRGVAVSVRVTGCPFAGMGVSAWNCCYGRIESKEDLDVGKQGLQQLGSYP